MLEVELVPNFTVSVQYEVNEYNNKKIPTIIDAFHKKISIFEILSRDTLDSIRSGIFKQLNGLS
jgi:hypothetical protein